MENLTPEPTKKRAYHTPELVDNGAIVELTQGTGVGPYAESVSYVSNPQ